MSELSDLLKTYMSRTNKTVIGMAEYCHINKSVMYRIFNGSRKPSSDNMVRRMSCYLELKPDEEKKLMAAYHIALEGKSVYFRRKEVDELLRNPFAKQTDESYFAESPAGDDCHQAGINGNEKGINEHLYETILDEVKKETGKVCFYVTDADIQISQILLSLLERYPDLSFDCITVLNDPDQTDDGAEKNIRKMRCLIPIAGKEGRQNIFWQYGAVPSASKRYFPVFSNYVITEDTVILISDDHSRTVFVKDPEMYMEYRKLFDETAASSDRLFAEADTYAPCQEKETVFGMCPGFSCFLNERILREMTFRKKKDRDQLAGLISTDAHLRKKMIQNGSVRMITAFEGYRDFMRHGILRDLPDISFDPLNITLRISILEEYIQSIQTMDLYVLKEPVGPAVNGMNIRLTDHSLIFRYADENGLFRNVLVNERSCLEAFGDYMETLVRNTDLFYTKEELRGKLNELLNGYRISAAI